MVFLDALVLKIRDGGSLQRKACYLALAINLNEILEIRPKHGRGVLDKVLNALKQRGVADS